MGSQKIRGRTNNHFLCCFRPAMDCDGCPLRRRRPSASRVTADNDSLFAYLAVGGTDSTVLPTILSAFSGEAVDGGENGRRKKLSSRRFSRALKAAILKTCLVKKLRSTISRENSRRSNAKFERILNSIENAENSVSRSDYDDQKDRRISFSNSAVCSFQKSSSFTSTSSSLNMKPIPLETGTHSTHCNQMDNNKAGQEKRDVERRYNTYGIGLYVLLPLVLLVLVFCGRLCAIICALTSLMAVPRPR